MTMLLPSFSKLVKGDIWRMEIDSLTDTVSLEIRTTERQVLFTSINLQSSEVFLDGYITPERWLTGIEAAYDGVLLLHNYQTQNSPAHRGITAIDKTGRMIWSNYSYGFDHLSVNGPAVFNVQVQPKKLFLIDVNTGTFTRKFEELIDPELQNYVVTPRMFKALNVETALPLTPHLNIMHCIDYNELRIVSLHAFTAGQLKQHLYIISGAEVVYEDLLNEDIQKMQPESFILYKNWLIYIKNRSELKVLSL